VSVLVSLDVGRSSVKGQFFERSYVGGDTGLVFPSYVTYSMSGFASGGSGFVSTYARDEFYRLDLRDTASELMKLSANRMFIFGSQAPVLGGGASIPFGDGETYHKLSQAVALYVCGYAISLAGVGEVGDVMLAVDLTYSNQGHVGSYSGVLKREHVVDVQSPLGRSEGVRFRVSKLFVFSQGYAALFNLIGTAEFKRLKSTRGLVIDVGRKTVDFTLVDKLVVARGYSVDLGLHSVLEQVLGECQARGLSLTLGDIEVALKEPKRSFSSLGGASIRPAELLESFLGSYVGAVRSAADSFLGGEAIGWVALVGGGVYHVQKHFSKLGVPVLDLSCDPVMANCSGMLSFLKTQQQE